MDEKVGKDVVKKPKVKSKTKVKSEVKEKMFDVFVTTPFRYKKKDYLGKHNVNEACKNLILKRKYGSIV